MITRLLRDDDELVPPYWNIEGQRPNKYSTIIAEDNGKICGLCWLAYGGPVAMIVLWISASPKALHPLRRAIIEMAKDYKCSMILGHVQEGTRFLNVLQRRGWTVNSWSSIAVGIPVNKGA